jgi:hypothetical protein
LFDYEENKMPVILCLHRKQIGDEWLNSAIIKAMLSRAFYSIDNMQLTSLIIHRNFESLFLYG